MSQFYLQGSGGGGGGNLKTLSDDVNTQITPDSGGNIQLVGHVNEQGSTKFSTVVAGTHLANINPMSSSRWIVDPLGFNGTHTTITSALASATSGDTIFLLPGTYSESLTLVAGVNITAYTGDGINGNVIISGEMTASYTGEVTISGCNLASGGANHFLVMSGAASINLIDCYLDFSFGIGISSSGSGSYSIYMKNCVGSKTSSGSAGLFNLSNSTSGKFTIDSCIFTYPTTDAYTSAINSSGTVSISNSTLPFPLQFQGSASVIVNNCQIRLNGSPGIGIYIQTSSTSNAISNCNIYSGTNSGIGIDNGTCTVTDTLINSSNSGGAIQGSGTLYYSNIIMAGTAIPYVSMTVVPLPSIPMSGLLWIVAPSTSFNAVSGFGYIITQDQTQIGFPGGDYFAGDQIGFLVAYQSAGPGAGDYSLNVATSVNVVGSSCSPTSYNFGDCLTMIYNTTGSWQATTVIGNWAQGTGQVQSVNSLGNVFSETLLSYQSQSGVSSVVFPLTQYNSYKLVFTNLIPSANADITLQLSTDGSTYPTTGYLSGYQSLPYNSATITNSNKTTGFYLVKGATDSSNSSSGVVYLTDAVSGAAVKFSGQVIRDDASVGIVGGNNASLKPVASIEIIPSTGTLSGNFSLYGMNVNGYTSF